MTQIITAITRNSILMASDTRLNYHEEVEENGQKYQLIKCVADCCRKTFFLEKAKIGIQFIGIGYLRDDQNKYHLSYFLPKLEEGIKGVEGIKFRMQTIFNNLIKITSTDDTGNYVNGVMAGFYKKNSYIGTFNTFIENNGLDIKKVKSGHFVDSEKHLKGISMSDSKVVAEICSTIKSVSKTKPHLIGDEVEILQITNSKASFIKSGQRLFYGTQNELLNKFKESDIKTINGKILEIPIKEKINL